MVLDNHVHLYSSTAFEAVFIPLHYITITVVVLVIVTIKSTFYLGF